MDLAAAPRDRIAVVPGEAFGAGYVRLTSRLERRDLVEG
jgi:aspartate/methionine/tyrosine aminotransferase